MMKSIAKVGNSSGIIFDAALLDLARLKRGDQMNVELHENGVITLTPLNPRIEAKKAATTAARLIRKNAELFRRLA
jgi:antitoxin component of MazEF toxin-antitoxin module